MNTEEISNHVWDMNTVDKSNLIHYLIGYANQNSEFKPIFEKVMSKYLEK